MKTTSPSSSADPDLLISDFEPPPASSEAEAGEEDEFDPIPVTGRKNSQGKFVKYQCWITGESACF